MNNYLGSDGNPGGKPGKSAGGAAPFPRGGKRREPANSSFAALNPRRPPPSGFAGGGGYGAVSRRSQSRWNPPAAAAAVEDADEFEVGSLYKAGSKKQSLNHLLNFQFAPRASAEEHHANGGRSGGGPRGSNAKNRFRGAPQNAVRSTYRKEHYLQANCQFVVRARGDYRSVLPTLSLDYSTPPAQ